MLVKRRAENICRFRILYRGPRRRVNARIYPSPSTRDIESRCFHTSIQQVLAVQCVVKLILLKITPLDKPEENTGYHGIYIGSAQDNAGVAEAVSRDDTGERATRQLRDGD